MYFLFRGISHNVTAAILVSQNNETAAMLVSQTSPLGVELFSYANAFSGYNKFAYMLATWVKTLYTSKTEKRLQRLITILLGNRCCPRLPVYGCRDNIDILTRTQFKRQWHYYRPLHSPLAYFLFRGISLVQNYEGAAQKLGERTSIVFLWGRFSQSVK